MRFGLQAKFLLPTIALLVLALGIAAVVSYTEARHAMDQAAIEQLNMLANATMRELASWIEQARLDLRNWGEQRMYVDAVPDTYIGKTARKAANQYLTLLKDEYDVTIEQFDAEELLDRLGRLLGGIFYDKGVRDAADFVFSRTAEIHDDLPTLFVADR